MEDAAPQQPVHYYEIDLLRFVAALAVVLFHFTYRGYHANSLSRVEYPALGEVFKYGYLGVQLFFIISGYVILLSARGKTVGGFFASRVGRLFPAYWVACTCTYVVLRLCSPAGHAAGWPSLLSAPSVGVYLLNLTMLQSFLGVPDIDGVYWTLGIELLFYLLVGLLIAFKWFKHLPLVLTAWLAYCAFVGPAVVGSPVTFILFPRHAPFFIAGMLFCLLQTSQEARWKLVGLLLLAYALALRAVRAGVEDTVQVLHQPFSLLVACLLVTAFFAAFWLVGQGWLRLGPRPWLSWAGALTYPLYLLHQNIGYVVFQYAGGHVNKEVLLASLLLALGGLSYLIHVLVERRYSKGLTRKLSRVLATR
jgi:peptidoglycan/LPS O-acetylase OafA/YrhL